MRKALLLLLLGSNVACESAVEPKEEIYAGYYKYGFEVMDFFPENMSEAWFVQGGPPIPCLEQGPFRSRPNVVYIKVRGTTRIGQNKASDPQYVRDLYISEVLSCRNITWDEWSKFLREACQQAGSECG
jgi:hypothetical protein